MTALLAGAFLRDAPFFLANLIGLPAPGAYRVAGGIWVALLCGIVIWLLADRKSGFARTMAVAACAIGAMNGLMDAGCRLALPPPPYPAGITECDYVTGIPIDLITKAAQVAAVLVISGFYFGDWVSERNAS